MREEYRLSVLERYEKHYDQIWQGIEQEMSRKDNAFWLMGAANYLFKTNSVCWAVDPMFNTPRSGVTLSLINPDEVFRSLSFVLITHEHGDHFDARLMERYPDIGWIVPEHLVSWMPQNCLPYITVIRPGEVIERKGMRIEAFSSPHFDAGSTDLGVMETGYMVDTGVYRILLPGDIRDYHAYMPKFDHITHLFSHVWLGRRNAENLPCGSFPEDFARFMLSFRPEKIYLTHLMEAERPLPDLWTYEHAGLVMNAMMGLNPAADITIPMLGKTHYL